MFTVVSPGWYKLMCVDSILWGENCTRYKGWVLGGFPKYLRYGLEYSDQTLHADRYCGRAGAGSQEFMTFCIGVVWERGKVHGFY